MLLICSLVATPLVIAIEQLGGELRIQPAEFTGRVITPARHMEIDGTDGAIVLRLGES